MRHERKQDRKPLLVVLKAVVHGNERYLNQFCFLIDHALPIAQIDPPVARLHNTQIQGIPLFAILPDVTVLLRSAERQ